jgi:hypothetical protein
MLHEKFAVHLDSAEHGVDGAASGERERRAREALFVTCEWRAVLMAYGKRPYGVWRMASGQQPAASGKSQKAHA